MHSLFWRLYILIFENKKLSLFVLFLLFSGLSFFALRLEFEEDITKLLPSNETTQTTQRVLKNINFADKVVVNIKRRPGVPVDKLTECASMFIDSVEKHSGSYIQRIQGKVNEDQLVGALNFVYQNLPLLLDENDYRLIDNKIKLDSIDAITFKNYKTLISPTGFITRDLILKDPLGLSFLSLKKLEELSFGNEFVFQDGFLLSKNKENILLFITPKITSSETDKNAKFVDRLYQISSELNANYSNQVEVEYYGGALVAVANAKQIKKDIQITSAIAVILLLIILIGFYRKLSVPIILFTPTVFGGLLALLFLYVLRGKISAISLGIGSVLLGVTLDYALHILTYIRNNGHVKSLYKEILYPTLMSSLTTALAFLCLLFLDSQALRDLGIFAAVSVIGASVFALIFIPQVYKYNSEKLLKHTLVDKVARFNSHKNKLVIILLLIGLGISFFTFHEVQFNQDLSKVNYQTEQLLKAEKNLDEITNIASKSIYVAAYSSREEDALKANDVVLSKLKELDGDNQIVDFSSIGSLVYSQEKQKIKINTWYNFWNDTRKNDLKSNLLASGKKYGFKPSAFNLFYEHLNKEFNTLHVKDYAELSLLSVDDYITNKGNGVVTVTSLIKVQDKNVNTVKTTLNALDNVLVIDRKEMNETFLGALKDDFNKLVGYSFMVVLIILLLFYRSLTLTVVTIVPVCLTWFLTVGLMGLFGIQFNIFNIIISTFIFGLGIDYSIFITNGLIHEYRTGDKVLITNKTSIVLSVLTTILGIGVLVFAKHPALYTISIVSIIGILSAIVISFTFQPLLFNLFIGSSKKRPNAVLVFLHSMVSFTYFAIGGLLFSFVSLIIMPILPIKKQIKMSAFQKIVSWFMKSVLQTNPFLKKKIINTSGENFKKQGIIIANHTSFLDILSVGMLHHKMIFLVSDWVYNSPIFGKIVRFLGFYPVSSGIENGLSHLEEKVKQGYSLMAFPEGTRSTTNKINRFHKGAFYLAEQLKLDIIPVLIHGNSEVLPKNSFIIKNERLTIKILDRIAYNDKIFGEGYNERTKKIAQYFRNEYAKFSSELEHSTYFHNIILEDYKYKSWKIYNKVKKDLSNNSALYFKILKELDPKEKIAHLSSDYGQLDFLLSMDSYDRKIYSYYINIDSKELVNNSFITHNRSKIKIVNTANDLKNLDFKVLIVDSLNGYDFNLLLELNFERLILFKEALELKHTFINNKLVKVYCNDEIIIYKK